MGDDERWDALHCHFTWGLDVDVAQKGACHLISYLLKDMRMNPDVTTKAMVMLSFVYMMDGKATEAEAMAREAIAACEAKRIGAPDNEGYRVVALANMAHIARFNRPVEEVAGVLDAAVDAAASEKGSLRAQAGIDGLMGYTFSLFEDHYMKGITCFQYAMSKDPNNFEWPLGLCILSRRLRQSSEGHRSLPTEMEEANARRAIKLSGGEKALPVALLADVLLAQGVGQTKGQEIPAKTAEASRLYHRAYELEPTCTYVLKRCGKAFSQLRDAEFAEKCLQEALNLDPGNGVVLHRLGQLYEFSDTKKDLVLAEKYYMLAVEGQDTKKRNVFADIDIARIRSKRFPGYNILQHYESIRSFYVENTKDLAFVDGAIERQKEYLSSKAKTPLRKTPLRKR